MTTKTCCNGNCNQGRDCPINKPVFSGEDFDAADHVSEVRLRPLESFTPAEQNVITMFDPGGAIEWTPEEIASLKAAIERHKGLVRPQITINRILPRPLASVAKCDHDWPEGDRGTDKDGSCTKCGMSFMLYIHCDCP